MVEFKAGDRVRVREAVNSILKKGAEFTVAETYEDDEFDTGTYVRLKSRPGSWRAGRFELVDTPVRTAILREAEKLINGDRQDQYGPPSESFSRIAAVMTQFIRGKLKDGVELEPHDVALFYLAGKGCRASVSPDHRDTWVDIAGFGALGGEVASGD